VQQEVDRSQREYFLREQMRGAADGLENDGDRPFDGVGIRDGQRDAFAKVAVELEDYELSGAPFAGDQRGCNAHLEHFGGELFFEKYTVHRGRIVRDPAGNVKRESRRKSNGGNPALLRNALLKIYAGHTATLGSPSPKACAANLPQPVALLLGLWR